MKTGIFFRAGEGLLSSLAYLLVVNCFISCLALAELHAAPANPPIFSMPAALTIMDTIYVNSPRKSYLYVSDLLQNAIYRIDPVTNTVELVSGTPGTVGSSTSLSPE